MVEQIAKQAATKDLSYRELREVVATERAKKPKDDSRGRPRKPLILKTLTRSLRAFAFQGSKQFFTKADVEELDHEQKKDALTSAQALMEKLKGVVKKLKGV